VRALRAVCTKRRSKRIVKRKKAKLVFKHPSWVAWRSRRATSVTLLAFAVVACDGEDKMAALGTERPTEAIRISPSEREVMSEAPTSDATPSIPGQLLEKLAIEREGRFALAAVTDELTLPAAVALGDDGLVFAGHTWTRGELDLVGQSRRWIGVVFGADPTLELGLDAGSIHAAISDGQGGALLVGTDGPSSDTRAWFGAIDDRGRMTSSVALDRELWSEMIDVLAGHDGGERALLLGNIGIEGWVVSVDARGAVRWQSHLAQAAPRRSSRACASPVSEATC
jgi:hypothetical protein